MTGSETGSGSRLRLEALSPLVKSALVQCSLFHGSFTQEAAEHILWLDEHDPTCWALDVIEQLVKLGLVETFQPLPHHTRFTLSADAMAFAAQAKTDEPKATILRVKSRHAAYYAHLGSERRIEALSQHGGGYHVHILMLEQANLRAGLNHALDCQEAKSAAGLLLAYSALVNLKGPPRLLTSFCEKVLESGTINGVLKLRVLIEYARALRISVGVSKANAIATQAHELAKELQNDHYEAVSLGVLGIIAIQEGNTQLSLELSRQALAIHKAANNRMYEGILQADMGILHTTLGDLEQARVCHEEALLIHREVGNRRCEGVAMTNLALINTELGEITIATELYEEAIVLLRETAHRRLEGCALGNLGDLYLNQDKLREAREYLETAVEISHEVGYKVPEGAFLGSLSELSLREGNLTEARTHINQAEQLMREANDAIELAKVVCRKGWLNLAENDLDATHVALSECKKLIKHLGVADENSLAVSIRELDEKANAKRKLSGKTNNRFDSTEPPAQIQ